MEKISKSFVSWLDARIPLMSFIKNHLTNYYAPKNLNFWYFFGSFALLVLVIQLITGIWLAMNYVPSANQAFDSVEYIMRDVNFGWLLRYMHSTGASFFFIVIYLHMFKALIYGSYRKPRELLWIVGMLLFLCLMAEAFMGYLLPWGQMSYWGAKVITSLFGAIPYIGDSLVTFITGDYTISGVTLNRFFSLHVVAIPLCILGLVLFHLIALHAVGSNNPEGIEIKDHKDDKGIPLYGIPFHPYYTVKDIYGVVIFLIVFCAVLFFMPEGFGYFLEAPNFEPADPMKTPEHIAPVWYFTPFYSMLRAVPSKLGGAITMAASIAVLFVLPWLDRSPVKSIRYKGAIYKTLLFLFVISFISLGYWGTIQPTPVTTLLSRVCTIYYFLFFIMMPVYSKLDFYRQLPKRIR